MTSDKSIEEDGSKRAGSDRPDPSDKAPGWTDGLRKLYDSVVDEPIPDSFKDLLSKLDESGSDSDSHGDGA